MIVKFRSKRNKQFYFRLVARNGKTVAASEGYKTRRNRDHGIMALQHMVARGVKVRDLEKR